ncbi:uncharacterized protein LODBEIA_P37410 [Lodderomyces beijingensis]|uniref:ferric-chelate reductase (NADPH) n=1 Tax=Lodderomyces beijingensis TaxID=1775926 RepID=A0ABP0ZQB7_9ASCO
MLLQKLAFLAGVGLWSAGVGAITPYTDYRKYAPVYGCHQQLETEVSFCPPQNFTCLCNNPNFKATIAGCLQNVGKLSEKYASAAVIYCYYFNVSLTRDWFVEAAAYYDANAVSASEIPGFNKSEIVNVPIILNASNTHDFQESYKRFYDNYNNSLYWGAGLLAYWSLVLILSAIINWSKVLFPNLITSWARTSSAVRYWKRYVSTPATFCKKKSAHQDFLIYFGFLVPSRIESLVIFLFYCIVIICNAIGVYSFDGEKLFDSRYQAEIRYVADRTGITATMIMPLIFLFAGRNNILQWFTRWNYATFLTYHRHISRVMFALVVIHSVNYTILEKADFAHEAAEQYFYMGILATVAGGLIMIQAILYLRRRHYEIFLCIHIILAVLWLVGTWYHLVDMGYIQMVYPVIAVWGVDRLVRVGRLVAFGFPRAEVTLMAEDTLRLVVPKPKYWHSIPGGHAFVHFIKPACFWQSHPFTFTNSVENSDSIVFYSKVKKGMTNRLYKQLVGAPGRRGTIRVGVEGPYGEATPAKYADSAVFIAGGNGIPGVYSEIVDIAKKRPNGQQSLQLIWVVRDWNSLLWFYQELKSLKNSSICTTIYITKPSSLDGIEKPLCEAIAAAVASTSSRASFESVVEKKHSAVDIVKAETESGEDYEDDNNVKSGSIVTAECVKRDLAHIHFEQGRPNVEEIVSNSIRDSQGSVAFVACGHPVMVDEVRCQSAKKMTNKEKKRVDFYEQLQVWA